MDAVLENFPQSLSWVKTTDAPSNQLGFHQGDPLAALLFPLISERAPGLACNAWFVDDIVLQDTKTATNNLIEATNKLVFPRLLLNKQYRRWSMERFYDGKVQDGDATHHG